MCWMHGVLGDSLSSATNPGVSQAWLPFVAKGGGSPTQPLVLGPVGDLGVSHATCAHWLCIAVLAAWDQPCFGPDRVGCN